VSQDADLPPDRSTPGDDEAEHPGSSVPSPSEAEEVALRRVDDLHRLGALDEGSRHVFDGLVEGWVAVWKDWRGRDHRERREQLRQELDEARHDEAFQLEHLELARRDHRAARLELERVGVKRAEPDEADEADGRIADVEAGALAAAAGAMPARTARVLAAHARPDGIPVAEDRGLVASGPDWFRSAVNRFGPALSWAQIVVLAAADAYGFKLALEHRVGSAGALLTFFVVALSLASVVAALWVGRLRRRARTGADASAAVTVSLAAAWLGIGVAMFWLRASPEPAPDLVGGSTDFGGGASLVADPAAGGAAVAPLLLGVYLVTGLLAMVHGYFTGDPRQAEVRRAFRILRQAEERLADRVYGRDRAVGVRKRAQQALEELEDERRRGIEECDAYGDIVLQGVRLRIAMYLADPSSTDGLTNDAVGPDDDEPDDGAPARRIR
jgi:hypothetical protein